MRGWWELLPHRWDRELAALSDAGWEWSVDDSLVEHGIRGLMVSYPVPEQYQAILGPGPAPHDQDGPAADHPQVPAPVRLLVLYPAAYPFFQPSVRDVDDRMRLPRHREPIAGKLCLIQPEDWVVGMTAAELIDEQMPRMLAAATASEPPPTGWEVPASEPLGRYTPDHVGARILVDSQWPIPPETKQGGLIVGFTRFESGDLGSGLVKLLRVDGQLIETFPDRVSQQFPITAVGRWLRWDGFTPGMTAARVWASAEPLLEPLRLQGIDGSLPHLDPAVEVIGILVPSEVGYRQPGEEWFFAVRHRPDPDASWRYELFHSAAAGEADMRSRSPATTALADRTVLLVGVGAIGGTVATELARAGIGRLDLVDGDVCDPATACRQYAPAMFAGYAKPAVLRQHLAETTPYVRVRAHCLTLGEVQLTPEGQPDPHHHLAHLIGHVDLVVDAAADPAVSRYLAALAAVRDTTFLHVSATGGGYGGIVAAIPAKRPGCWWCMLHHRAEHTLPFPPAAPDPTGSLVPVGCAAPTFTGTSADLATIAVHAARVAIDRLTDEPRHLRMRGDLYVAALRDHHGRAIPVRWRTRPIPAHPDCPMQTLHGEQQHPADAPRSAERAATAPGAGPRTVTTTAAGTPIRKAATARTLTTPQRKRPSPTGAGSDRRGGARPESGPTGGD